MFPLVFLSSAIICNHLLGPNSTSQHLVFTDPPYNVDYEGYTFPAQLVMIAPRNYALK
jgi:hypothetical protein